MEMTLRTLKYPARCSECDRSLARGGKAWWNSHTREIHCVRCHGRPVEPETPPERKNLPWVVLDVETTGVSPANDRVVEIGMVERSGNDWLTWSTLVQPQRDTGPAHVHGITDRDVLHAPTFKEILGDVLARLDGKVLIAHNLPFDRGFLEAEALREGHLLHYAGGFDTLKLSRKVLPHLQRHKLETLLGALDIVNVHPHAALGDALATAELFQVLTRSALQGNLRVPLSPGSERTLPPPRPTGKVLARRGLQMSRTPAFSPEVDPTNVWS